MNGPIEYASFLIRIWREPETGPPEPSAAWHSELEHIQTGERWHFDTLEDLLAFLRRQTEEMNVAQAAFQDQTEAQRTSR